MIVSTKEKDAQKNRLTARQHEAVALANGRPAQARFYVADMAAAHQAWQNGDFDSALALLRGLAGALS